MTRSPCSTQRPSMRMAAGVRIGLGSFLLAILSMAFAGDAKAQVVTGVVREAAGHTPIAGATVEVSGPDGRLIRRVETDRDGGFRVTLPGPGLFGVAVQRLGYGTATLEEPVEVGEGEVVELALTLSLEPMTLEGIVARTMSPRTRAEISRGTPLRLLERHEIEDLERRSAARTVGDLARRFAGVRVYRTLKKFGELGIPAPATCIEAAQRIEHTPGCDMVLVVMDGMIVDDPEFLVHDMSANELESLEFLKPTEGGLRYGTLGGNGVLLISTRGSGEWARKQAAPRPAPEWDNLDLALVGAGAGAAGMVMGLFAACLASDCPTGDLSRRHAAIELASIGLMVPLGVHAAAGRRGSLPAVFLGSLAAGAAGYALWSATDSGSVLVLTPVLQIVAAVSIERWSGR